MEKYGFIITRHVNSEKTNKYWNHNIQLLKQLYGNPNIVIIDDNSNYDFVKTEHDLSTIRVIQSEFPGRGELLPYYYLLKYQFFENAFIIHDSVFLHKKINFDSLQMQNILVLPLWDFPADTENVANTKRILRSIRNSHLLEHKLDKSKMTMHDDVWYGCFGVQCYINLEFLKHIQSKYNIMNLINVVHNRKDRCCLERIFGCIFFTEYKKIKKTHSILGNILQYQKWGYSFDQYEEDCKKESLKKYKIVKVWSGR